MTKLIANMVVRNEGDQYLDAVLKRLTKQVDQIFVTDDCSDDNTVEIAEDYGAIVQRMPEPTFAVHEGRLRQASWDHLEKHVNTSENTWVLAIDADEMLYETKYPIRDMIERHEFDVIAIEFYHMWNEHQYRVDKAWRPNISSRLFRYFPNGQFMNKQLACGSEPSYVMDLITRGRFFVQSGLQMKHLSYVTEEGKRNKYTRYTKIDGGAFHANAHIESIMDPNPVLMDWTLD